MLVFINVLAVLAMCTSLYFIYIGRIGKRGTTGNIIEGSVRSWKDLKLYLIVLVLSFVVLIVSNSLIGFA